MCVVCVCVCGVCGVCVCVCVCVWCVCVCVYCERVKGLPLNVYVFCGLHRGGFIDFI